MSPREKDHHSTDKFGYKTATEKKGGAGAYSWGQEGDMGAVPAALDKNDPNYDSEEERRKEAKAQKK